LEGSIDIGLVVTIGGIIFSVAGAAAVAQSQIKNIVEMLHDLEARYRTFDQRLDKGHTQIETQAQKLGVLAKMMDPSNEAARHREMSNISTRIDRAEKDISKLISMHNGKHPKVE